MATKNDIRQLYKQKRASMSAAEISAKSHEMSMAFLSSDIYKSCKSIMIYKPIGNEADTALVASAAYKDGKRVAYPVTDANSGVITPVYADFSTAFSRGAFRIDEPDSNDIADICDIDVFLVPGIAFDRCGGRIGFGKGCYDRLLADADGIKIGWCYSEQICESITSDKHDMFMDYIITEGGLIICDR